MAITLADDGFSDAEITDGIGLGRIDSAARLWVRYWPTALATAREYVEAVEVPGLAAEALVGTIAAIAVGHGPREDAHSFVVGAVRELGEGEVAPPGEPVLPDVFVSALMTRAFSGLGATDQDVLRRDDWAGGHGEAVLVALGALQRGYLTLHVERAEGIPCIQVHNFLSAAATDPTKTVLSGEAWVHLSACAICTEAFHEVAFTNVALEELVEPAVLAPPVPLAPLVDEPVVGVAAAEDLEDVEPLESEQTVVLSFPVPEPVLAPAAEVEPEVAAVAEPEAEAEPDAAEDPWDEDDARAASVVPERPRRRRRGVGVLVGAVAVAASIAVVTVVLGNQGDSDDVAAAKSPQQSQQPAAPTPTAYVEPPVAGDPTGSPLGRVVDGTPTALATEAATGAASEAATPTKAPRTPKPTRTPKPSSAPGTSDPKPDPTPSAPATTPPPPSPTAKPCNPLAHLLGMC